MWAHFSSLLTRNKRSSVGGYTLTKHSGTTHEYSVNDRDRYMNISITDNKTQLK